MRYNTFILFGAPGSGKVIQGKTLGTIPRFYHCACGDVFRSIDTRTKVGKAFLEYSSKGELVPDEITVELWREAIEAAVDAHKFKPDIDTLVLDGIPRNIGQAKIMEDMIDVKKMFHLSCSSRETLFTRLKKRALKDNRLDDANEQVIQRRLDTFRTRGCSFCRTGRSNGWRSLQTARCPFARDAARCSRVQWSNATTSSTFQRCPRAATISPAAKGGCGTPPLWQTAYLER